ncbi:hypothetical protein DYB28_000946 [Aphanomyces astaci]|uniref:FYVE zinc finger domain-containing protein n=2 Tax=Aphanomyces astaci TaxID=112090 RepID=A0A9X8EED7_APHAT|nr:hypothetical protein DYB28_000946 [Aphanomyces astaci]
MAPLTMASLSPHTFGATRQSTGSVVPSHHILPRQLWVSKKNRSGCVWCGKSFGLFRHRHHCRLVRITSPHSFSMTYLIRFAVVKVCRLCIPTIDPTYQPNNPRALPRRRTTMENVKLLDTIRCVEYSNTPKERGTSSVRTTVTSSSTASLPNSPSASELKAAILPSSSMVATLAHLLQETADTQATLAVQTSSATHMISAHGAQIERLNQAIARIEAKFWEDCAGNADSLSDDKSL